MRLPIAVAALSILASLACAGGGSTPPSASKADAEIQQSTPPCMGNTDGDCPSGNPMEDY